MRIAIFSDNFYPELTGISDSITLLGRELGKRGHSVLFVVPRYAKKDYQKAHFSVSEQDYGPNVSVARLPSIIYPCSPTGQSRIAIPLGFGINILKKFKPDIIHVQSPFGVGIEALFDARVLKIPLVGTNHTPIAEFMLYSPFSPKWLVDSVVRFYSWYYDRCSFVSAPCNALLADMSLHGFRVKNHRAVPNPTDLSVFSPVKSVEEKMALKKRFGFSQYTVLYTGRLAQEKNIDVVIRAIARVKKEISDICFAVTGHGNAEDALHTLVENLGLKENVKFLGYVDAKNFPLIYQASDIFTIMSTAETQSLSMMQAMASGLPVIGARAWGLPEYIDSKNGVVVEPGDEAMLAQTIIDLFKNPSRIQMIGEGGIISVKKYAPSVITEQWEKIYEESIIKNNRRFR